uniref:RNA-directed DNA polymerase, eukaryota, reverse transcriptase zinc-binding domain protein n=1 Tax=Tanacetum cinerariifolium TaxID=118510 RepID=A0A6L2M2V1_TANCI|nr:RNA-directed DNA polymerase, eukaryota, reverse transcriptase zinc-binding domain protein [Tanacetum cinerariifolium]
MESQKDSEVEYVKRVNTKHQRNETEENNNWEKVDHTQQDTVIEEENIGDIIAANEPKNDNQAKSSKERKNYASVGFGIGKQDFSKKLFAKPIVVDDNGNEFAVFDDIIINHEWLCNVRLEAWTTNGINALASRLGTPLIMDNSIVEMCKVGIGRVSYARVLVEVNASKCLPNEIENENGKSHNDKGKDNIDDVMKEHAVKEKERMEKENDGFIEVKGRKNNGGG